MNTDTSEQGRKDEWIALSDRLPRLTDKCDFLFAPNDICVEVWMVCSTTIGDVLGAFDGGDPKYWRSAQMLPTDIVESVQHSLALRAEQHDLLEKMLQVLEKR